MTAFGRLRFRDVSHHPWRLPPGPLNAITDVEGVRVGHVSRIEGDATRTGVTAILPYSGNLFRERPPAGLAVANGHGKLAGATQLEELGELETPIVLVNTLSVGRAVEAVVDWTLGQPGNEDVRSVNAVVGETNDGELNDIRRRGIVAGDVLEAIAAARAGPVEEGCVGCGVGVTTFGLKAGIGTSSRLVSAGGGAWRLGILTQANLPGFLRLGEPIDAAPDAAAQALGSVMIVLATDAPLTDRNLKRLAWRALFGVARTGATFDNGSGDYAIAFSTHEGVRRGPAARRGVTERPELGNDAVSPLFAAALEASEEAILNALVAAEPMESRPPQGFRRFEALDLGRLRRRDQGGPPSS